MTYTAKVGERGQITIPKPIRDQYGLRKGMTVEVELAEGQVRLRKRVDIMAKLEKYRGILGKLGKGIGDVDAFIEDIRGR